MESTEITKPSLLSIGLKFGVILGLSSATVSLLEFFVGFNAIENSWVNNIINLVLTTLFVVLAHKAFKDEGNGFMSYGQGLGLSMITVLVALIITGIYSYAYFNFIDPGMMEGIWEKAAADMEAQGRSEQEIEFGLGIAKKFFWVFFILGAAFWGFLVGLIVSIFTQKKAPETAF